MVGRVRRYFRINAFLPLPHSKLWHRESLVVVRRCIVRIVSAYSCRIVNEKCLSKPCVRALLGPLGLSVEPSLSELFRRIRAYMYVSPEIFRHFQKLSWYLGRRADWFTHNYDLP